MILLHLLILFQGVLCVNLVSRIKPSCLWRSSILTLDWLKESGFESLLTILQEMQTSTACFLGLELKSNFHWKAHFLKIVRSWFNSRSISLKSRHFKNKVVSSANMSQTDWMPSGKSLIYIKKRSGPRSDPCGILERTLSHDQLNNFQ